MTTSAARRMARTSPTAPTTRSEEHTSELQSRLHLVCRLLLEKKKKIQLCLFGSFLVTLEYTGGSSGSILSMGMSCAFSRCVSRAPITPCHCYLYSLSVYSGYL